MVASLINELIKLSDLQYKAFNHKLLPSIDSQRILGVSLPKLRGLAKKVNEDNLVKQDFLNQLPHVYLEENHLHAILILSIKDEKRLFEALYKFLPYLDNWQTVDLLRPLFFKKQKNRLRKELPQFLNAPYLYTRRLGIGFLLSYFLKDSFELSDLQTVLNVSTGLSIDECAEPASEAYYLQMMQAWYFSEAFVYHYDTVYAFFERAIFHPFVLRKSIQKARESFRLSKEQKSELLQVLNQRIK